MSADQRWVSDAQYRCIRAGLRVLSAWTRSTRDPEAALARAVRYEPDGGQSQYPDHVVPPDEPQALRHVGQQPGPSGRLRAEAGQRQPCDQHRLHEVADPVQPTTQAGPTRVISKPLRPARRC